MTINNEMLRYSNHSITLGFSSRSGALQHLSFINDANLLGKESFEPALDARLGWENWLSENHYLTLVHSQEQSDGITLEMALGPLGLHDSYKVDGDLITRSVRVENRSEDEVQLTSVRLRLVGLPFQGLGDILFEAPASYIRPRLPLKIAVHQQLNRHPDEAFVPGAVGWLQWISGAPDVTPGLLAIHCPESNKSVMIWYFSEVEAAQPQVYGDGDSLILGHELGLAGWMAPGTFLEGGNQYIQVARGTWSEALGTFRRTYHHVGIEPPVYGSAPEWVSKAAIYEVHPGPFGGFRGLTEDLPRIRAMGFDVLYLMPVMEFDNRSGVAWDENWSGSGSPYAMKDFEKFEPTLGTREEFHTLVGEAQRLGMKVLMDFVAQGCALDARYVNEHPEWFCRDEGHNLVSSHGWNDTYSLDWANPDYQAYMLNWALRFMREFDLDGYRIDAPHGKEPNWDRTIPYHASCTNLGLLRLLEQLQKGIKQIKPEAALLSESFGPVFVKSHDFQYDYHPYALLTALLTNGITPYEFGEWLRDYWAVMPPSALRVAFTETHDTRDGLPAYAWRGSMAERAMFAILIMAGFIPMVWSGQEAGLEIFYQHVLTARAQSEAILHGERGFNAIPCDNPQVLSILCSHRQELIWGVVSLYAERTPLTFDLSGVLEVDPEASFHLHDLLENNDWNEYGRDTWNRRDSSALTLSLIPYVPYFLKMIPSTNALSG